MAAVCNASVRGDRALGFGDEDKLGFRDVAARMALSLVDHASDSGLVVGINRAWGSGKSSLLFLIEDELGKLPRHQRPTVINFRPWLVGNRDALISNLFAELSKALDQVALSAGDSTRVSVAKAKEAGEALRKFARGLGKAGAAVEVAGDAVGLAPIKWGGKGLKALGELAKGKPREPQLTDLKEKLIKSLQDLGHRFVITIDDVDRLEPKEAVEVLRLARSVADFPNVVYLLCYDSGILGHGIERAAEVKSGRSYLEKIVQLTVMVPKPEPFQLRQWFTEELHSVASPKNEDELSRLKTVIDYEGGRQLRTPRSVIRALDSIRFFWPPLDEARGDLADLVWLQLIKDGNPALYRWIENYCATAAVLALGTARVEDAERAHELSELYDTVGAGHFDDHVYRHYFAEQLAGMEVNFSEEGLGFKLYQRVGDQERDSAIRGARIASPDHYRLYFALAGPSHALTQDNFDSMWAAAGAGPEEVKAVLLQIHNQELTGSLSKADVMLERIRGDVHDLLSPVQCENLLIAFSHAMDDAYRQRPFDGFWINTLWDRAERLLPALFSRLEPDQRTSVVQRMFNDGAAIGWLTSLLRRETFAHGRYGSRMRPEDDWLFTDAELDHITGTMLDRYRGMSAAEVFSSVNPISLLFAWRQGGDEDGPKQLVEASIESDTGLIETLEGLISTINSSDRGSFNVLKKDNVEPFLDYDAAVNRVDELRTNNELGERARRLAVAFEDGVEY